MAGLVGDVRFRGLNGSRISGSSGPLMTQLGHRPAKNSRLLPAEWLAITPAAAAENEIKNFVREK
jgi:hypothetical protein